ncbi:hypothetical protein ED733_004400 [Metarhizium rileyi]|uniref:Zinc finger, FYVE domain containing protein n=1 Tax=Metarhizium rileyi (strain RCEF 4871) TaxID=1649241 RepID=A0A5C6GJ52_METRR|nr:hypothetical protein ED733_004400 [Metarhizium rileyi]
MSDDVDMSLLSRLQALRGGSATPEKPASNSIKFDTFGRAKAPTKGDMLANRLKSLRSRADSPSSPVPINSTCNQAQTAESKSTRDVPRLKMAHGIQDDVDALFETDDQALEEMLADVANPQGEPEYEDVQALLEQLSASIPHDSDDEGERRSHDWDKSDVEEIARQDNRPPQEEDPDKPTHLKLPSVPGDHDCANDKVQTPQGIDDITARMAALRAPTSTDDGLPSVPTSKPSKRVNRLTSRTNYTDDDADSWCTVCLEDATLRCLGCDGDVYCTRCWREMHTGPAAAWDERSHKAVQFTRDGRKEKKVALGA